MAQTPAVTLDDLRFIYVTGKGGVGKTTVCAALARAMAARGKRVLVAMCNSKERLSSMLGGPPIGPDVVSAAPNIDAVNMVPEKCLEEYGVLVLRSKTLYQALFENKYVKTFFRAVPGLYEWSMLGKAWWHTTELLSGKLTDDAVPPYGDAWKYEVVIVDAPATGHGLDMLRVPKVLIDVSPGGPIRKEADRAWRLFQDRTHAGVVLVALPEDMPANETVELATEVRRMNLPIPLLVVNGMMSDLFSGEERTRLAAATGASLGAARARAVHEVIQDAALAKLGTLGLETVHLPFLIQPSASEPSSILRLARLL